MRIRGLAPEAPTQFLAKGRSELIAADPGIVATFEKFHPWGAGLCEGKGMGTLITFSGVDCSGKSTQLGLLEERLRAAGKGVRTLWFRPGYSKELDGMRAAVRRLRPGLLPRATGPSDKARQAVFTRPSVRNAWVVMALVDAWVQYALKLRVWGQGEDVILCDRYLWDAELDLQLRFPELKPWIQRAFQPLRALSPKPDLSLLLVLPLAEAERRMASKDEPFPDPQDTRHLRYHRYLSLASGGDFHVVDAAHGRDEVAADIWEALCASQR